MPEERRRPAAPDRRRHPRGGRRTGDAPGRHPRVIVADAYEAARRPCAKYLEHFLFDVAALQDGDAVSRELDERPPAIILMGTNLSNPSTGELLERAATREGIPVILFADTSEQAPPAALTTASAVLVKPFTLQAMLDAVRIALRSHRTAEMS